MVGERQIFVPAYRFDENDAESIGLFSDFEPGTRTLPVGFQVQPRFQPLAAEIVLDKDVAVALRDGTTMYVDILRPPGTQEVPVIVAWSPYGKVGATPAGT